MKHTNPITSAQCQENSFIIEITLAIKSIQSELSKIFPDLTIENGEGEHFNRLCFYTPESSILYGDLSDYPTLSIYDDEGEYINCDYLDSAIYLAFIKRYYCEIFTSQLNKNKTVYTNSNYYKATEEIIRLTQYPQGWYDGVVGTPASMQGIKDALIFADKLNLEEIHPPFISLASDGEISFWWDLETIKLALGFYGDGTYNYFAKLDTNQKFYGDDLNVSVPLPTVILEKLISY